jgi:hypothetical protein
VIAAATAVPPGADTAWSRRLPAGHLPEVGISASQIGPILSGADLEPHLVRGWLTRPADPEFFTRAARVCALYRTCPPGAVVLSIDEKTGIAARCRKHPGRAGRPGRRTRREFEYVRHGTVCIVAALNVHAGQVLTGRSTPRSTRNSRYTWSATTARHTPRARQRRGWPGTPGSPSASPLNTPPGWTRPGCSSPR